MQQRCGRQKGDRRNTDSSSQDEAMAAAEHSKAIKNEHKLDMDFLSARSKHDSALAELKAKEDALNATKRHTLEQSQLLEVKQKEVEEFRGKKAADDVGVSFLYSYTSLLNLRKKTARKRGKTQTSHRKPRQGVRYLKASTGMSICVSLLWDLWCRQQSCIPSMWC